MMSPELQDGFMEAGQFRAHGAVTETEVSFLPHDPCFVGWLRLTVPLRSHKDSKAPAVVLRRTPPPIALPTCPGLPQSPPICNAAHPLYPLAIETSPVVEEAIFPNPAKTVPRPFVIDNVFTY
jgi:hypothetical protein